MKYQDSSRIQDKHSDESGDESTIHCACRHVDNEHDDDWKGIQWTIGCIAV